jgi:hypothetical protein
MDTNSILIFYKEWLASLIKTRELGLYDLTSVLWRGKGLDWAGWGYNRDKDKLLPVNYALLFTRITGSP